MQTSYLTLRAPAEAEIEVKRSRFRGMVAPAADEDAARAVIDQARSANWDAGHHCSAFILTPTGRVERSSDDGEPSGTAGAPMLDVLRGRGLTDVVAVVSRWFGGTLLGAGGLVRAYGDAVREALDFATAIRQIFVERVSLDVDHADAGRIENEIRAHGFAIHDVTYAASATLEIDVPPTRREQLEGLIARLTSGAGSLTDQGSLWAPDAT